MEWNGVKKIAPRNDARTILNCSLHSTRLSRSIFTAWSARIFMEFKTLLCRSAVQCNAVQCHEQGGVIVMLMRC
jgi:hypothetical protein